MIYTCNFSGLGDRADRAISVCIQQPPKFHLPVAEELCPPFGMYWKKLRGKISDRRFAQLYRQRFGVLDPRAVAAKYDGMILVAWEGYLDKEKTKPKFSHRHMIAEWLRQHGFECEELPPIARKKKGL